MADRIGRPMSGGGGKVVEKVAYDALALAQGTAASLVPTPIGTNPTQLGPGPSFLVKATTIGGAAVTVDTGFAPALGHAAQINSGYSARDVVGNVAKTGNGNHSMRHLAVGAPVVAGAFAGNEGDTGTLTTSPSYSISGANTLQVTFTPPIGYPDNIDWILSIDTLEN